MESSQLSSSQAHALFDILTHHETYAEIQALKIPDTITKFGPPLKPQDALASSSSPLIQSLLNKFIYILPGLRDVAQDFWIKDVSGLVYALAKANLSESYDKGSIGIRKTLSTAIASIVEYVSRGCHGGYPAKPQKKDHQYDTSKPEDAIAGWDDFLQQIIYGDMLDRLFAKAAETDQLSDHESVVQAAHEYILTIVGSFLHYTLVVCPRGQSILPLLTRANGMLPYFLIRQTLRVGNAASMLNGMVKIVLAKVNLSTVTTWFGGAPSDSGMNLLQQIISTVLNWDTDVLRKRVAALEKEKDSPNGDQLRLLRTYSIKPMEDQRECRIKSEAEKRSMATIILSESTSLSEAQHNFAMEYLAMHLAIRDREELISILCCHQPDLLTSSIRHLVKAYDPIIRALHRAVDLSSGVSDLQAFLTDLIGISKVEQKSGQLRAPTVEDYCRLLKKHQRSSHRFIHQVLKNGKDLSQSYHEYATHAAAQYKQRSSQISSNETPINTAAGDFTAELERLVSTIPDHEKITVMEEIDTHAKYLSAITEGSENKLRIIIHNLSDEKSEMSQGPGMYLSRWQTLLDETLITPATPQGTLRRGGSESVKDATRVDIDGAKKGIATSDEKMEGSVEPPPDVSNTVRLLVPLFRDVLATTIST